MFSKLKEYVLFKLKEYVIFKLNSQLNSAAQREATKRRGKKEKRKRNAQDAGFKS